MTTIVTAIVKTTNEKTKVIVLLAPEGRDKQFVPGLHISSYRFEKIFANRRDILGRELSQSGAVAKISIRVHPSQVWIEQCLVLTHYEHVVALLNEKNGFALEDVYSLSPADYQKIIDEEKVRKAADWSRISKNSKRLYELATNLIPGTSKVIGEELLKGSFPTEVESVSIGRNENYFYISQQAASAYYSVGMMLKTNIVQIGKILMVGPSGWGKTSLPKHFAKINGLNFLRMDCSKVRDPEEWFGFRGALNGSTTFTKSDFVVAIETGNVVIVLDEINRIEPYIANTLFPILDDACEITINNDKIKAGKNVLIVGTINVGFEYTGTFQMDAALANRFEIICPALKIPASEEVKVLANREALTVEVASKIVDLAEKIRSLNVVDCSLRTTLSIARIFSAISSGKEKSVESMNSLIRIAFQHVLINRVNLSPDLESRQLIDVVNSCVGPLSEKKVSLKIF